MVDEDLPILTSSIEKKVIVSLHPNIALVQKESTEALREFNMLMSSKKVQAQQRQTRKKTSSSKKSFKEKKEEEKK